MRIAVWGCGYLGTTHATALAELSEHEIVGIEVDRDRLVALQSGEPPFFEPGLGELLRRHLLNGRLRFSSDLAQAADAEVHFVCVGTPQLQGSPACDLRFVDTVMAEICEILQPGAVVVGKSSVPVGTAERLEPMVLRAGGRLVWNPEFLREGTAVEDSLRPDRIVLGASESHQDAADVVASLYRRSIESGSKVVRCSFATAELVKAAANAFLALKISFINALAELCDASGGDVVDLADALGMDDRIGRKFLNAGVGFGGGCLPKDLRSFGARAAELGVDDLETLVQLIDGINLRARHRAVAAVEELLRDVGRNLNESRTVVLGAAFKPNSDDIRDSAALSIIRELQLRGAEVRVVDPVVRQTSLGPVGPDALGASAGADAVILATEWEEFRNLDPALIAPVMRTRVAIDGRNVWDPKRWRAAGFSYRGMGRS